MCLQLSIPTGRMAWEGPRMETLRGKQTEDEKKKEKESKQKMGERTRLI